MTFLQRIFSKILGLPQTHTRRYEVEDRTTKLAKRRDLKFNKTYYAEYLIYQLVNFLLYSNIYIALCAVAMTFQTLWLSHQNIWASPPMIGLAFFATLFIYAGHRLLSLRKLPEKEGGKRFEIIHRYSKHIQLYTITGAVGAFICLLFMSRMTMLSLILPALISIGYILPVIGPKRLRLRDLHFVKIFLIAIVWAYVTVGLPLLVYEIEWSWVGLGMLVERALFIFGITLPFDIRDRQLDKKNNVKTLPVTLGFSNTLILAGIAWIIWIGLAICLYPIYFSWSFVGMALLCFYLLYRSPQQQHDYYFTGIVDGTMLLHPFLIWLQQ